MEVAGWDRLPDPPCLLVGIHSGAPFPWDAWTIGIQWWRHFGEERLLRGTAHDALMATPLVGAYFRKMGVIPAAPDSMATVGGPDAMPVLTTGRRLARALRLDRVARLKMFPFALQAPWGVSPALLPEVPLPTKIRTEFQEPIKVSRDPAKANDDAYLEKKYEEVQSSIQRGMDILARHRRLPLFG